jgi:Ferritin-like domain
MAETGTAVAVAVAVALIVGCDHSTPAPPAPTPIPTPTPTSSAVTDADILTFALNLEYLEAEFYLYAATGSGLSATDAGSGPAATVPANTVKVPLVTQAIAQYANEITQDELNHIHFLRAALSAAGATVQPRPAPAIDNNSITFARTPQQILAIVTGTAPTTIHQGVFFPSGLNGTIK